MNTIYGQCVMEPAKIAFKIKAHSNRIAKYVGFLYFSCVKYTLIIKAASLVLPPLRIERKGLVTLQYPSLFLVANIPPTILYVL